jgi:hypothetical protein
MTRKDYELIAEVLKDRVDAYKNHNGELAGVESAAYRLSNAFAQDNPRFNRGWFLKACGME